MPTIAAESKEEVEEFLLDKFQSNLMRSLVDGDGFWDVALHLGALALWSSLAETPIFCSPSTSAAQVGRAAAQQSSTATATCLLRIPPCLRSYATRLRRARRPFLAKFRAFPCELSVIRMHGQTSRHTCTPAD